MAQVTGATAAISGKLEISTDGTTYTDISGATTTVAISGGGRTVGETYTLDGDTPLVTVGKSQPLDLTVTCVYTEGGSDVFEVMRVPWESGGDIWVRWAPKGGQTGEFVFTAGPGKVSNFNYPPMDATSGNPIMTGFVYHGPRPTKSVAA